jgi:site-specific DNA recombinase
MIIYDDKHAKTRKIIRAVIYIRFSSHVQKDSYSIEYQQEECLKFIENRGYKFVSSYIDEAKSGKKTAGREALEQMLFDAGRNKFDRIIVFSFSRSFRNTRDALNTNHELMSKHGITIESVIEPIDLSSPHGKFSGTNLFAMHELQSDIIAAHVRSGMYIAAKQGYYLGGYIPFGYDVYETGEFTRGKPRKKYCIDESESEIVKEIFKMYLDGFSINYIRDELLARNIRAKKGGYLNSTTLNRILKHEFYIGTREFDVKGYEKLSIENAVPAIIDIETFNAVQAKFKANKEKPQPRRRKKRFYPLTGKIECAQCGGHYNGVHIISHYQRRGYSHYICYNKRNVGNCNSKNIRKEYLEEYCIKQIKQHILTPEKIKEISAYIVSQIDSAPDLVKEERKSAEKRKRKIIDAIKEIEKKRIEANEAAKEAYDELIAEYSHELTQLNEKLARLETIEDSVIDLETVENYLQDCVLSIDSPDPNILKSVFDKLIEKIVIHDDKVVLYLIVFPYAHGVLNETQGCPCWSLSTEISRKALKQ